MVACQLCVFISFGVLALCFLMKPARLGLGVACQSSSRCTNRAQVVSHEAFFLFSLNPFSRPGECDLSFRRSVLWQSTRGDTPPPPPRCFLLLFLFFFVLVSTPCRSLFVIQQQTRCMFDRFATVRAVHGTVVRHGRDCQAILITDKGAIVSLSRRE